MTPQRLCGLLPPTVASHKALVSRVVVTWRNGDSQAWSFPSTSKMSRGFAGKFNWVVPPNTSDSFHHSIVVIPWLCNPKRFYNRISRTQIYGNHHGNRNLYEFIYVLLSQQPKLFPCCSHKEPKFIYERCSHSKPNCCTLHALLSQQPIIAYWCKSRKI